MDNEKITPPEDLEAALTAALGDVLLTGNQALVAESILYSESMQDYLRPRLASGETATEEGPEEPITVTCTVKVPLSSPPEAAAALSHVPINARITYETGSGILSGILGVGALIATWTEER